MEEMDVLPTSEKGVREEEGTGGGPMAPVGESREKKVDELTSETRGRGESREAEGLMRRAPVAEDRALSAIISAALAEAL